MGDDGLFGMFTNDDAFLFDPLFLTLVNNNAPLNSIDVATLMVDDYGKASLPNPLSLLPLDGTILCNTLPIPGHDILSDSQPLPPLIDDGISQGLAMLAIDGNFLVPSPPLGNGHQIKAPGPTVTDATA